MDYFKKASVALAVIFVLGSAGIIWSKTGVLSLEKQKETSHVQNEGNEHSSSFVSSSTAQGIIQNKKEDKEDMKDNEKIEAEGEREDGEFDDEDGQKSVSPPVTPPVVVSGKTYTVAEVALHNNKSSCWSMIDGSVYDLTSWISQHPGGEAAILSLCGNDGTSAFHDQHGNNSKQANILATFKIGIVAK